MLVLVAGLNINAGPRRGWIMSMIRMPHAERPEIEMGLGRARGPLDMPVRVRSAYPYQHECEAEQHGQRRGAAA